jgi:lipopolysaccharide transport system ATP-binding protein
MPKSVVVFEEVWKKFRRGERHDSLRDLIPSMVRALRSRPAGGLEAQEFWALKNVSFEVLPGQALGIIGPNGAGKSTILKLLTRILRPNRGCSRVQGRVGALIEIAAGFHGDLTGRENIYLQGAIMGMRRAEIQRKLDEIIEFAGVGEFLDTQVKRYSSGMNARLGFAVAAHLDPDVLIIDEVLGVGDMAFQSRCIERMHEFKRRGVAIVFVSHNLQAVSALCERTLYLRNEPVVVGDTDDVLQLYSKHSQRSAKLAGVSGVGLETATLSAPGGDTRHLAPGTPLTLAVTLRFEKSVSDLAFGFTVHRATDLLVVYDTHFSSVELGLGAIMEGQEVKLEFSFDAHLVRGLYDIECFVHHNPTQTFLGRFAPVASFTISELRSQRGVADLRVTARAGSAGTAAANPPVVGELARL